MKLSELTPEQKRIAIAEACGWKQMPEPGAGPYGEYIERCWISPTGEQNVRGIYLPNYPADLNAMHEAESTKHMPYNTNYVWWLGRIACKARGMDPDRQDEVDLNAMAVFADAEQRADAFLLATGRATV